jgi:hypothetical protein
MASFARCPGYGLLKRRVLRGNRRSISIGALGNLREQLVCVLFFIQCLLQGLGMIG